MNFQPVGLIKLPHFAVKDRLTILTARGGEVCKISGRDTVFLLATTRASNHIGESKEILRERLLISLGAARSDLDWDYHPELRGLQSSLCVWG